jgi:hypothetical protein
MSDKTSTEQTAKTSFACPSWCDQPAGPEDFEIDYVGQASRGHEHVITKATGSPCGSPPSSD